MSKKDFRQLDESGVLYMFKPKFIVKCAAHGCLAKTIFEADDWNNADAVLERKGWGFVDNFWYCKKCVSNLWASKSDEESSNTE